MTLLSNSAGSADDADGHEAKRLGEALGVHVLQHGGKKPSAAVGAALLQHFSPLPPSAVAIVGDRLFTDILLGNQLGCVTILTAAFTEEGDSAPAVAVSECQGVRVF